jgi:hypothetical protein
MRGLPVAWWVPRRLDGGQAASLGRGHQPTSLLDGDIGLEQHAFDQQLVRSLLVWLGSTNQPTARLAGVSRHDLQPTSCMVDSAAEHAYCSGGGGQQRPVR